MVKTSVPKYMEFTKAVTYTEEHGSHIHKIVSTEDHLHMQKYFADSLAPYTNACMYSSLSMQ